MAMVSRDTDLCTCTLGADGFGMSMVFSAWRPFRLVIAGFAKAQASLLSIMEFAKWLSAVLPSLILQAALVHIIPEKENSRQEANGPVKPRYLSLSTWLNLQGLNSISVQPEDMSQL